MKYVFVLLLYFLLATTGVGQSFVDRYYADLIEDDRSIVVQVSGDLFQYASIVVADSGDDEVTELLAGIRSLKVVALEGHEQPNNLFLLGLKYTVGDYEELVSIKSMEGRLSLNIDEEDNIVNEVVIIGAKDSVFFVASILTEIKLEDLSNIIKKVQKESWQPLKELSESDYDQFSISPNPVAISGELTIHLPESMLGGKVELLDGSGSILKGLDILSTEHQLSVEGLETGSYTISISLDETTFKRKVLIVE